MSNIQQQRGDGRAAETRGQHQEDLCVSGYWGYQEVHIGERMWRLSHDRLFQRESKSIQGEVLVLSDYMRRYVIEQEADDCLVHGFQGRNNSNPFREKSSCAVLWPFLLISTDINSYASATTLSTCYIISSLKFMPLMLMYSISQVSIRSPFSNCTRTCLFDLKKTIISFSFLHWFCILFAEIIHLIVNIFSFL